MAVFYNAVDYVRQVIDELTEADVKRMKVKSLVNAVIAYPALSKHPIENSDT